MFDGITVEVCAGSYADVLAAAAFPIDRIELNCALELGGLTPTVPTLQLAKEITEVPVLCMVRPRAAGFCYRDEERMVMIREAEYLLENGADGIVFGILKEDHTVNEEVTRMFALLCHAYGQEAVFHRAFDETPDPFAAMETLIACGIDRVLTSGQKSSALEGAELIGQLTARYGDKISILPGAGITADTVIPLLEQTKSRQIHLSAKSYRLDGGSYPCTDPEKLLAVKNRIEEFHAGQRSSGFLILNNDSSLHL